MFDCKQHKETTVNQFGAEMAHLCKQGTDTTTKEFTIFCQMYIEKIRKGVVS